MTEIKSVLLIDNNDLDNFINHKILESHGVTNVTVLKNAVAALPFLAGTTIYYQYILVDIHLPMINGFQFIDKFNELGLNNFHGHICLLSASINPLDKELASERNVRFIEKPLTIEKLLIQH
jgi:CheY-like chemotaxis protein